jgi:hypothetical protein
MRAKKITYIDFNGVERTETHYFNISKHELVKMRSGSNGGIYELMQRAIDSQNEQMLGQVYEDLIDMSYGVKTADGRGFKKSPELLEEFKATGAYDALFIEMLDAEKFADFINGILPADLAKEVEAEIAKQLPAGTT